MARRVGMALAIILWPLVVQAESLMTLDLAMREQDIQLQRANQNVSVSQARRNQADSRRGPRVRFDASGSQTERRQSRFDQRFLGEDYSITLSQSVYDRPQFLEPERLDRLSDRAIAGKSRILQERRLSLLQSFAGWVEALEHQKLLTRRYENLEQRREQIVQLFANQRVSITELLRVENELERVRVELVTTRATAARTESLIASLTGSSVKMDWNPQPQSNVWDFNYLHGKSEVDRRHPVLAEAQANLEAAQIALDQAIGTLLPTIGGELTARQTNIGANDLETERTDTYSARIALTWILYDSGDREARIKEARFIVRDAELALMEAERELLREQQTLDVELERAEAAWSAAKAERISARKLVEAANRSFELGVGDLGDTLMALDRLIDAEMRVSSTWLSGFLTVARIAANSNRLNDQVMSSLSLLVPQ